MINDQPPSEHRTLVLAVVTAAATTLVTALATWAVDELRSRYGSDASEGEP